MTDREHLERIEKQVARLRDVAGNEGYPHLASAIADIGEAVAFLLAKPKMGRPPKSQADASSE